jgi:glutaredoxin 2
MEFPGYCLRGRGKDHVQGTERFTKIALDKFHTLAARRQHWSNTHAEYRADDFEDLLWSMRKVVELYRQMVGAIRKYASALDAGQECTREHLLAVLEERAAFAQVELLVAQTEVLAATITADYKDKVLSIIDWDSVE